MGRSLWIHEEPRRCWRRKKIMAALEQIVIRASEQLKWCEHLIKSAYQATSIAIRPHPLLPGRSMPVMAASHQAMLYLPPHITPPLKWLSAMFVSSSLLEADSGSFIVVLGMKVWTILRCPVHGDYGGLNCINVVCLAADRWMESTPASPSKVCRCEVDEDLIRLNT